MQAILQAKYVHIYVYTIIYTYMYMYVYVCICMYIFFPNARDCVCCCERRLVAYSDSSSLSCLPFFLRLALLARLCLIARTRGLTYSCQMIKDVRCFSSPSLRCFEPIFSPSLVYTISPSSLCAFHPWTRLRIVTSFQ